MATGDQESEGPGVGRHTVVVLEDGSRLHAGHLTAVGSVSGSTGGR